MPIKKKLRLRMLRRTMRFFVVCSALSGLFINDSLSAMIAFALCSLLLLGERFIPDR
jgi:hypothetical protein